MKAFGKEPVDVRCQNCEKRFMTSWRQESSGCWSLEILCAECREIWNTRAAGKDGER